MAGKNHTRGDIMGHGEDASTAAIALQDRVETEHAPPGMNEETGTDGPIAAWMQPVPAAADDNLPARQDLDTLTETPAAYVAWDGRFPPQRDDWADHDPAIGHDTPTVTLTALHIPRLVHDQLAATAYLHGISVAAVIVDLLQDIVGNAPPRYPFPPLTYAREAAKTAIDGSHWD